MAALTENPTLVPTDGGIPTYHQIPETSYECESDLVLRHQHRACQTISVSIANLQLYAVEWANLATLDLSQFDKPGGKAELAKQLHEAIQKIGQSFRLSFHYYAKFSRDNRLLLHCQFWLVSRSRRSSILNWKGTVHSPH